MHRKPRAVLAAAIACGLLAAGCSSAAKHAASSETTLTIGVLTDLTGAAAGGEASVIPGIKAGIGRAAQEGYHIKYVAADAATSPTGAQTAAKDLVEQDHVFAVLAVSALTFAAAGYLKSAGVPVIGAATDGPEWETDSNMFPVEGAADYHKVWNTVGTFMKMEGVTNMASLGYGITPSSSLSAKSSAAAAQAEGIKVGYLNANFPFGAPNVEPVALGIKSAGSNGLYAGVETSTSFALITALRQAGVHLKAPVLPIGYGGDLLSGGAAAESAAVGVYFPLGFEPAEMHTAATERFQHDLKTYAGVSTDPSLNEYFAYVSVDAFVAGLKAAGAHPSQKSLINAMLGIT
ncbi:MAG: ABC transporter substrate-binding protein, partial [Acidimicrobiaceae bacterium]|nr:ABC transporter substrate-binding protein [Acidimicrobiaceae bacterium]